MKCLSLALLLLALAVWPANAQQNAQVIGPITVGDCALFNSTTIIKDSGVGCSSSVAPPAGSVFAIAAANAPVGGLPLYASPTGSGNCLSPGAGSCSLATACSFVRQIATFIGAAGPLNLADGSGGSYATATGGSLCLIQGNSGGSSSQLTSIQGNSISPTNVVLQVPSGANGIVIQDGGEASINNLEITAVNGAGPGIQCRQLAVCDYNNITWGSWGNSGSHVGVTGGASSNPGTETLTANAVVHWNVSDGSHLAAGGTTNIPSAIVFSVQFLSVTNSNVDLSAWALAGSGVAGTTGQRASLSGPGYLTTAGNASCNSVLPGNSPCSLSQGYQDSHNDPQTDGIFLNTIMPATQRAGDIVYNNGSGWWQSLAGNNSGTNCLSENASGVPAWASCGGGITVGTTTITGGTSTGFLYNNAGVLGNSSVLEVNGGGISINTALIVGGGTPNANVLLTVNKNAANPASIPTGTLTQLTGTDGNPSFNLIESYQNGTATAISWHGIRNARGTGLAPTASQNGDNFGGLCFEGHDGTNFGTCGTVGAAIIGQACENWVLAGTHYCEQLIFQLSPPGTNSMTNVMTLAVGALTFDTTATLTTAATGSMHIIGTMTAGANADSALRIDPTITGTAGGAGNGMQGLSVQPTFTPTSSVSSTIGTILQATVNPRTGATITTATGLQAAVVTGSDAGAITTFNGINLPAVYGTIKPTTVNGINIGNLGSASIATSTALNIAAQSGSTTNHGIVDAGDLIVGTTAQIGSTTPATLSSGELDFTKISASGTAPTAGNLKIAAVAGTNAGSCKLIAYAGTSTTPVTIIDNVGAGC